LIFFDHGIFHKPFGVLFDVTSIAVPFAALLFAITPAAGPFAIVAFVVATATPTRIMPLPVAIAPLAVLIFFMSAVSVTLLSPMVVGIPTERSALAVAGPAFASISSVFVVCDPPLLAIGKETTSGGLGLFAV
jgi:hypothetical protein